MVTCCAVKNESKISEGKVESTYSLFNPEVFSLIVSLICVIGTVVCHFGNAGELATYLTAGGSGLAMLTAIALHYCCGAKIEKNKEEPFVAPPQPQTGRETVVLDNVISRNFGAKERAFILEFESAAGISGIVLTSFTKITLLADMSDNEKVLIINYIISTTDVDSPKSRKRLGLHVANKLGLDYNCAGITKIESAISQWSTLITKSLQSSTP